MHDGDCQVRLSIVIKIANRDRARIGPRRDRQGGPECPVAIARQDDQPGLCAHGQVGLAVQIEIAHSHE
jgi:hypothetical protein